MTSSTSSNTINAEAMRTAEQASQAGKISASAMENLKCWLSEPRYREYAPAIVEHIQAGKWRDIDDAFWTIIPFGTGGRRGKMYPFGSNSINDRTIGESAQGLADYVKRFKGEGASLTCAIAYDTRHRSRHFAELCASIMVANGFTVYFLDDYRATPQLSLAVRYKSCDCGIMVTASHNPPSDNAVKVYWSTGGQILPPHDKAIIDCVMSVDEIKKTDFQGAVAASKVQIITKEIDDVYLQAASQYAFPGPRNLKIIYSPLHGVGSFAVLPLLDKCGFSDVHVYPRHAEPNGDFPNVPGHVSNPENTKVFDDIVEYAKAQKADLILATDPDCDRMGCSAPLTLDPDSAWATLNGNQLGAILTDFVFQKLKESGKLTPQHYAIITLVTTNLTRRIAESYGGRCEGNIHVGFKWIAELVDRCGPETFAFGTEESHGYLIGTYARDKDGAVACLLMSLLAADLKAKGLSLHQRMDQLLMQHGYHVEDLLNVHMEGSEGMSKMKTLMAAFRAKPPKSLGGIAVTTVRDYEQLTRTHVDGPVEKLDAPKGNMVVLDLADEGNYVAVRPSGTEPKVKFYFFSYLPPAESKDLASAKARLNERLAMYRRDIEAYTKSVVG